jgi:hypothetical protein
MESGEARSRADLARREGVSAMRVTQVLALLDLHPAILDAIRSLPPGTPERLISERKLRPLTRLPQSEQLRAARQLLRVVAKREEVA